MEDKISEHLSGHYSDDFEEPSPAKQQSKPNKMLQRGTPLKKKHLLQDEINEEPKLLEKSVPSKKKLILNDDDELPKEIHSKPKISFGDDTEETQFPNKASLSKSKFNLGESDDNEDFRTKDESKFPPKSKKINFGGEEESENKFKAKSDYDNFHPQLTAKSMKKSNLEDEDDLLHPKDEPIKFGLSIKKLNEDDKRTNEKSSFSKKSKLEREDDTEKTIEKPRLLQRTSPIKKKLNEKVDDDGASPKSEERTGSKFGQNSSLSMKNMNLAGNDEKAFRNKDELNEKSSFSKKNNDTEKTTEKPRLLQRTSPIKKKLNEKVDDDEESPKSEEWTTLSKFGQNSSLSMKNTNLAGNDDKGFRNKDEPKYGQKSNLSMKKIDEDDDDLLKNDETKYSQKSGLSRNNKLNFSGGDGENDFHRDEPKFKKKLELNDDDDFKDSRFEKKSDLLNFNKKNNISDDDDVDKKEEESRFGQKSVLSNKNRKFGENEEQNFDISKKNRKFDDKEEESGFGKKSDPSNRNSKFDDDVDDFHKKQEESRFGPKSDISNKNRKFGDKNNEDFQESGFGKKSDFSNKSRKSDDNYFNKKEESEFDKNINFGDDDLHKKEESGFGKKSDFSNKIRKNDDEDDYFKKKEESGFGQKSDLSNKKKKFGDVEDDDDNVHKKEGSILGQKSDLLNKNRNFGNDDDFHKKEVSGFGQKSDFSDKNKKFGEEDDDFHFHKKEESRFGQKSDLSNKNQNLGDEDDDFHKKEDKKSDFLRNKKLNLGDENDDFHKKEDKKSDFLRNKKPNLGDEDDDDFQKKEQSRFGKKSDLLTKKNMNFGNEDDDFNKNEESTQFGQKSDLSKKKLNLSGEEESYHQNKDEKKSKLLQRPDSGKKKLNLTGEGEEDSYQSKAEPKSNLLQRPGSGRKKLNETVEDESNQSKDESKSKLLQRPGSGKKKLNLSRGDDDDNKEEKFKENFSTTKISFYDDNEKKENPSILKSKERERILPKETSFVVKKKDDIIPEHKKREEKPIFYDEEEENILESLGPSKEKESKEKSMNFFGKSSDNSAKDSGKDSFGKPKLNLFNKSTKKSEESIEIDQEKPEKSREKSTSFKQNKEIPPPQRERVIDSELQSNYETYFMRFSDFFKRNRELFADMCQKEEDKIFYYDDSEISKKSIGLSKSHHDGVAMKSKSKMNLKKKIFRGFMSFQNFKATLKSFEFSLILEDLDFKAFLNVLQCFDNKNDRVYYMKLIRETYRKKPLYNLNNHAFTPCHKKLIDFKKNPEAAISLVKKNFLIYREYKKKKALIEKKTMEKTLETQISYEDLLKNPEKTLDFLREKILGSDISLEKIFKAFDKNNDGKMSFSEFKSAMEQTGVNFKDELLSKVFKKFDILGNGQVSYMEFLAIIYKTDTGKASFFDYLSEAEAILDDLRLKTHERFHNHQEFQRIVSNFENQEKITCEEFMSFVKNFTDRYSRIQLIKLFDYLDKNAKKSLNSSEFWEIYEHQIQKQPLSKGSPYKKQDNNTAQSEKFSKIQEFSNEFEQPPKEIWGDRSKLEQKGFRSTNEHRVIEIFTGGKEQKARPTKESLDNREKLLEMEIFLQELSEKTKDLLKVQGKNLRDLFNMFSKDFFGYMNRIEFERLMEFIWKNTGGINKKTSDELFKIYANKITKRLSFNMFLYLINLGNKINPIYLKFKFRFGANLEGMKTKLIEEFQKFDTDRGSGLLDFAHFEKLLKINDITLTHKDHKYLTDEGFLLIKSPSETYLNYRRLLYSIFPQTDQITQEFMRRAIQTIIRIRAYIKKQKKAAAALALSQQAQEELQGSKLHKRSNKGGVGFKNLEASDIKKKPLETSIAVKDPVKDLKAIGLYMKPPKELFEFEGTEESQPKSDQRLKSPKQTEGLKKSLEKGRKLKDSMALKKTSIKSQMQEVLPSPSKEDPILKENHKKMLVYMQKVIEDCITSAFQAGESLLLTKEIQRKYEKRPILKDVFICMQDLELEVLDIIPRSLHISNTMGRILQVSKDSILHEIDISNGTKLNNLNLGAQIPLKSSKILDIAFDSNENRLYVLTDKWILEIWELHQNLTVPLNRIRILPYRKNYQEILERVYSVRNYAGDFPHFLVLSSNNPKEILINCSAINNSVVFFDPVSMSVSNQIFLNLRDYRLTRKLARNINKITEKLQEIQKTGVNFEDMFHLNKNPAIIPSISFETFRAFFRKNFGSIVNSSDDIEEILAFINQKNDNLISKDEFLFLFELPKILNLKKSSENSLDLAGISGSAPDGSLNYNPRLNELTEKAMKILKKMGDFFRKSKMSPENAFKIFDTNDSGHISVYEFNKIVDQISGFSASEEEKEELIGLFDKDKNGTVEFKEFLSIYSQLVNNVNRDDEVTSGTNVPARNNLILLFEKCFEAGIDIEEEFLRLDQYLEGNLEYTLFKNVLKWIPAGLLDQEIDTILNKEVVYSENGRVNYLVFIQNPVFRQMKLKYLLRKSLINQAEFKSFMQELTSEENVYQNSQKIIIESLIYLESLELLIYTTACPISSIIYISTSAKRFHADDKSFNTAPSNPIPQTPTPQSKKPLTFNEKLFENKLLARLIGHKTSYPPTIFYCEHSGCLISGEKLEKPRNFTELGLKNASSKPTFLPYYSNIETSKDIFADILIWNIQKTLFENYHMNPPWSISPCKVISQAHYDSILDFCYLPVAQLLVSSSLDRTIKVWDPVAKPFQLNCSQKHGYIRIKPGFYKNPDPEYTRNNQSFIEIKRIYTGDSVCYKLGSFLQKLPLHKEVKNSEIEKEINIVDKTIISNVKENKFAMFEMLFVLELNKPQMIGNGYKRSGNLRGFFLERLKVEVEARFHDDLLPEKYMKELESLFLERKRKLKVYFQGYLPLLLENVKSKTVLQRNVLNKLQSLLKKLALMKFQRTITASFQTDCKNLLLEVYKGFLTLPLRPKTAEKDGFVAAELYYYLKKFHCLHPFSMSKEQFQGFVDGLKNKNKAFLSDFNPFLKKSLLESKISEGILKGKIDIHSIFKDKDELVDKSKENHDIISISKEKLHKTLEKITEITFTEEEFFDFWSHLDPYLTGEVLFERFEGFFSGVFIEKGLRKHARPNEIISKLLKTMKKQQKIALMFFLAEEDYLNDGYLNKKQFINAINKAGVKVDKEEAFELFEAFAEKFTENDQEKVLSISFFSKKLFSPSDNLHLNQIYRVLGKIKANLLAKGFPFDYFFKEFSKNYGVLRVEDSNSSEILAKSEFIKRLSEMKMTDVSLKDIELIGDFLSIGKKNAVSCDVFLHYLRKTQTKHVFLIIEDFKVMNREIFNFLSKEKEIKEIYKNDSDKLSMGEIRGLLIRFDVANEVIDEILIRIMENDITFGSFMDKLKEMMKSYETLMKDERNLLYYVGKENQEKIEKSGNLEKIPENTENIDNNTLSLLKTSEKQEKHNKIPKLVKTEQNTTDSTIQDLFKGSSKNLLISQRNSVIKSFKKTEILINFIRTKAGYKIPELMQFCQKFDDHNNGMINFSAFINILRVILDDIPENCLLNFHNEWTLLRSNGLHNAFDYHDFFNKYLIDSNDNKDDVLEKPKEPWREVDLNVIYKRIEGELKNSNINLNYALKFFDQNQSKSIPLQDFNEMLSWLKIQLSDLEFEALYNDLGKIQIIDNIFEKQKSPDKPRISFSPDKQSYSPEKLYRKILFQGESVEKSSIFINSDQFLRKLRMCNLGVSTIFNEKIWFLGASLLNPRLIEVCYRNIEFIRFLFQQKTQKNPPELDPSLILAMPFFEAMSELKADFSLDDAEILTKFAIIGSKQSIETAELIQEKMEKGNSMPKEIINYEHFFLVLPIIYDKITVSPDFFKKKKIKGKEEEEHDFLKVHKGMLEKTPSDLMYHKKNLTEEVKFLLAKIAGILKDRDISFWDAILTSGVKLNENARISVVDFKAILRSLDLQLSLKEKLLLIENLSTEDGLIDLQEFLKRIESKGLTETAIRVLMEKLAVALFYNDMSLKRAFECFDLNRDGCISKNEFLFGMGQLDLGLSLFEITQVMNLMDIDHNGKIDKDEFINTFHNYFEKLQIDPVKDFSLGLLAKIKSLLSVKGADLLQCFIEFDQEKTGFIDMQGLKTVLNNFGLPHIKPYEITTLIRLYYEYDATIVKVGNNIKESTVDNENINNSRKSKSMNRSSLAKKDVKKKENAQQSPTKNNEKNKKSLYFTSANMSDKIDYKLFTERIYTIAERNSKTDLEITNELFRKVFRLFSLKNISLFEAFVYFDVNSSYTLSRLELKLGLNSLDLHLNDNDFTRLWNGFQKNKGFSLRYPEFLHRFVQAGSFTLIKFDDLVEILLKRFIHVVKKLGNYEESFRKLDKNLSGQISIVEFKEAVKHHFLGFSPQEAEMLFKHLCKPIIPSNTLQKHPENDDQGNKIFGYRQFSKLLSQYNPRNLEIAALAKLEAVSIEKRYNWKNIFNKYSLASSDVKAKNPNELLLQDLKKLLRSLKTGLSIEEIDLTINSCESDPISYQEFDKLLVEAHKTFEQKTQESNYIVLELLQRFKAVIERERLQIERLFFDFDEKQAGYLDLAGFTQMALFLKISSNKHQVKSCFQAMDIQRKGYITLGNFKSFMEDGVMISNITMHNTMTDNSKKVKKGDYDPEYQRILDKIKENIQMTFSQALKNIEFQGKEPLNDKTLGKLLMETGVVLPKNELMMILKVLVRDLPDRKLTLQEFLDLSLREGLESAHQLEYTGSQLDASIINQNQYIPPQVIIGLEKLVKMLIRLEIPMTSLYKYMKKTQKPSLSKKDLMKGLQSMDLNLLKEDLLQIYQYFDEKGFGEISEENFLEKIQMIMSLKNMDKITNGKSEEFTSEMKKLPSFASKQQAILVLQRISHSLEEKGYNRKQIKALFDRNSNGLVNREELLEGLKALDLGIPLDKCRILIEYLDKKETGVLEIDEFLKNLYESQPEKGILGNFKENRMKTVLLKINEKLKASEKQLSFLKHIVNYERLVRPSESYAGLSRLKIGIMENEFYQIIRENGIKLTEEDKGLLKDFFQLRINPEYYDLEALYTSFESLIYQEKSNDSLFALKPNDFQWEAKIYRNIANFLRKSNLSLLSAFQCIDQDRSGLISHEEFKRFIKSIDTCQHLSDKELLILVSNIGSPKPGYLSYIDFREKFLKSYSQETENTMKSNVLDMKNSEILSRKLQDMRISDRRVILRFLRRLLEVGSMERGWVMLDEKKRGIVKHEDLIEGVKEMGLFFNKGELGFLFNFLDKDQDGMINFMEYLDFYTISQETNAERGESNSNKERKMSMKQLEFEIFEHICKILNQKEVSLYSVFQESDPENKGYLTPNQFTHLLNKMGVYLSSDSFDELLKILDFKHPDKLHYSDIELKFLSFGLKPQISSKIESFDFRDKLLMRFSKKIALFDKPFLEYLRDYDENFDGFLTTKEFFTAIRCAKVFDDLQMHEIQRLAHIFECRIPKLEENNIEIAKIKAFLEENNKKKLENSSNLLDFESFGYLINYFDGFNRLFQIMSEIHSKLKALKAFPFGYKLRGFKLLGNKATSQTLLTLYLDKNIKKSLKFSINLIKNNISQYINNETAIRLLNPLKGIQEKLECADKQVLQHYQLQLSSIKLKTFSENSSFSIDSDSLRLITPYIKKFKGFSFERSKDINIFVYPKDTLLRICKDGLKYEEHLIYELKLQSMIYTKYNIDSSLKTRYINEVFGIYEKKLGIEVSDKDIYVLQETFNSKEFLSLSQIIQQTGGLLRIPFLTKTSAVGLIIKLWAYDIIEILYNLQEMGAILPLIKPENLYISKANGGKIYLQGLKGVCKMNEMGIIVNMPDISIYMNQKKPVYMKENLKNMLKEAYIAPEIHMKNPLENTHYVESWSLGCILYEILFGKPPMSFYGKEIEENIGIDVEKVKNRGIPSEFSYYEVYSEKILAEILKFDYNIEENKGFLVEAIEKRDFAGFFKEIFDRKNDESLAEILNIIALCLQFEPYKRPSISNLYRSVLFKQDKYQKESAQEFAQSLNFFKSPSQNLKYRVLEPLKTIYKAFKEEKNSKLKDFTKEILEIIEILCFAVFERGLSNKKLNELKKNVVGNVYKNDKNDDFPWVSTEKQRYLQECQEIRAKLPNYGLVKFIFDYDILDLLIYIVLHNIKRNSKNVTNILEACKDLYKLLFSELSDYKTTSAPFVDKILNTFIRLFIGEDNILLSDEISQSKFTQNSLFRSLYWTPEILHILGGLYKETISESGLGKSHYVVLQDYIKFCEKHQKLLEFQPLEKIQGLTDRLNHRIPKGFDYYRDIYTNAENLRVLLESRYMDTPTMTSDQLPKTSSLRIVISYVKGVLESMNTDKIKALLDSRMEIFLINCLNTFDSHLKTEILEVFYMISQAYTEINRENNRPEIEEINKTLGIITHMALNNEDRLDRTRFLDSANEYFSLNRRIIKKFLESLAEIFETPTIISPLFSGLKNPSEIQINKVLVLKIFNNLLKAPKNIIRNLTIAALDVFPSVFKLLVTKKNSKNKNSNALIPEILNIFQGIVKESRPEILRILEETPGIRALLREQELEIPVRLSVMYLHSINEEVREFYKRYKNEMIMEVKAEILKKIPRKNEGILVDFSRKIENCIDKYISWLKYYYILKETPLIEAWKLAIEQFEIFMTITNDIYVYGNVNPKIQGILMIIASFPDKLCQLQWEYLLFNPEYEAYNLRYLRWMLEIIENINNYHNTAWNASISNIPTEDVKLKELINHENLRKYAKNLLSPVSQAFSRVFLRLLERNNEKYHVLLKKLHFTEFFIGFLKQQYNLLQKFMLNQTEDIQIIENYVEEANIRLKTFESLLSSHDDELKKPLIETHFIEYLAGTLLLDTHAFDTQCFKSTMEFLPFREFLPIRNEALTILTSFIWNKEKNSLIYKELLVGISHNNLIQKEFDELRKNKEGVIWVSGLFFFSIMIRNNDEQIIYLMKHEGVIKYFEELFEKNQKVKIQFPDIQRFLTNMTGN